MNAMCFTIRCYIALYDTAQHSTLRYYTILYMFFVYHTILDSRILYDTMLFQFYYAQPLVLYNVLIDHIWQIKPCYIMSYITLSYYMTVCSLCCIMACRAMLCYVVLVCGVLC